MKRLKRLWFVPFALLAVLALVAASPTPRKLLSETFTNWIMIEGLSPMIYHDTTSTSGGSLGMTYYRDNDDNVDFSAGVQYSDGDVTYYSLRTGEYNGPLGIYVDTDGDVGVGKAPGAGYELDVDGDIAGTSIDVASYVEGEHLTSTDDATITDKLTAANIDVTNDLEADQIGAGDMAPYLSYALTVGGQSYFDGLIVGEGNLDLVNGRVLADNVQAYGYIVAGGDMTAYGYHWIEEELYVNTIQPHDNYPSHQHITFSDTHRMDLHNEGFVTGDDAEAIRWVVLREATFSDSAWCVLYGTTGGAAQMHMPDDSVWTFEAQVSVMTADAGEVAGYRIVGVIENIGGNSTLQYSSVTTLYEDDTSWDAAAAEWDPDGLKIQVRDADGGGDAIRAVAVVDIAQVAYP